MEIYDDFIKLTGDIRSGALLTFAIKEQKKCSSLDGYWRMSRKEMMKKTMMSSSELNRAREQCSKYFFSKRNGVDPVHFYKVHTEILERDLKELK